MKIIAKTTNNLPNLRSNLLMRFEELVIVLKDLCTHIMEEADIGAWIPITELELANGLKIRNKAVQLYNALWYDNQEDGRETITCPGIIGASPHTLAIANACNIAKEAFKLAVLALKSQKDCEKFKQNRQETILTVMRSLGIARLNLKQAYRRIPVIQTKPIRIGFTWSKQGKVIQRMSKLSVQRLLEKRANTQPYELQLLSEIHQDEKLAHVRSICPHLLANVVLPGANGTIRRLIQAPLPILIPLSIGESLPSFVPITPEYQHNKIRTKRIDVQIENKPFLPSVRIHRYRNPYRFS